MILQVNINVLLIVDRLNETERTKNSNSMQNWFVFIFNERHVNEQHRKINVCSRSITLANWSQLIRQTERKSNESHAAYDLFFLSSLQFNMLLLQCNFARCLSLSIHSLNTTFLSFFYSLYSVERYSSANTVKREKSERHATPYSVCAVFFSQTCFFNTQTTGELLLLSFALSFDVLSYVETSVCSSDVEPVGRPIMLYFVLWHFLLLVSGSIRVTMKLNIESNSARPKLTITSTNNQTIFFFLSLSFVVYYNVRSFH